MVVPVFPDWRKAEVTALLCSSMDVRYRISCCLAPFAEPTKGVLISREYPQAVLFLELPPELVDVNVHPAKMEVRFQEESAVFSIIRNGIGQALSRYELGIMDEGGPVQSLPEMQGRPAVRERSYRKVFLH